MNKHTFIILLEHFKSDIHTKDDTEKLQNAIYSANLLPIEKYKEEIKTLIEIKELKIDLSKLDKSIQEELKEQEIKSKEYIKKQEIEKYYSLYQEFFNDALLIEETITEGKYILDFQGKLEKLTDKLKKSIPIKSNFDLTHDNWNNIKERLKTLPEEHKTSFIISENEDNHPEFISFPLGALTAITAPSGHGKTTILINFLVDAMKNYNYKRHYLFSYEEDELKIYIKAFNCFYNRRLSANNFKSLLHFFRTNDKNIFNFETPYQENETIEQRRKRESDHAINMKIFENDLNDFSQYVNKGTINIKNCTYTIQELCNVIEQLGKEENTGLIFIDYIQLIYSESYNQSRKEELKDICLMLKDTAIKTNLCIVLASQFNREVTAPHLMHMTNTADSADIERAVNRIYGAWAGNHAPFIKTTDKNALTYIEGAEIRGFKEDHQDTTIHIMTLKDREGKVGQWATFRFIGNQTNINNIPIIHGKTQPYKEIDTGNKGGSSKTKQTNKQTTDWSKYN